MSRCPECGGFLGDRRAASPQVAPHTRKLARQTLPPELTARNAMRFVPGRLEMRRDTENDPLGACVRATP